MGPRARGSRKKSKYTIKKEWIILLLFMVMLVGAIALARISAQNEIATDITDQSGDSVGTGTISVRYLDDKMQEVGTDTYESFVANGVEISYIEFVFSYEISGTNIDESTVEVQVQYTISHNLDSDVYAQIVTNTKTFTGMTGSVTVTIDLADTFDYFLHNEEAQGTHDFNIRATARFVVTARSNAGQYLTATDDVTGYVPLTWNPDTITVIGRIQDVPA